MLLVGGADKSTLRSLQRELARLKRTNSKCPFSEVIIHTTSAGFRVSKSETRAFPSGVPVSELTIVPAILNFASGVALRSGGGLCARRSAHECSRVNPSSGTMNRIDDANLNIVTHSQQSAAIANALSDLRPRG